MREQWNDTAEWTREVKGNKKHYKVELFIVLDFAMYKQ